MQTSLFDRDSGDADDDGSPGGLADGKPQADVVAPRDGAHRIAGTPRQTFAVGRLTARQAETELVNPGRSPLPGPWRVKAVVEDLRHEAAPPPQSDDRAAPSRSGSSALRRFAQLLERFGGGAVVDASRRLLHTLLK